MTRNSTSSDRYTVNRLVCVIQPGAHVPAGIALRVTGALEEAQEEGVGVH